MSDQDVTKMKVADLKKELKTRGLSTMGNKTELQDRLQSALLGGDPLEDTATSEDLLEDDVLNDDDDLEEKELLDPSQEEDGILKSPTPSETSKADSPEHVPHKKIALKRNISISAPICVDSSEAGSKSLDESKSGNEDDVSSSDQEPDKKVIKLVELTAKERLELRAKKFGAATTESKHAAVTSSSTDAKKEARAARFGLNSSNSITSNTELTSVEALRKRAERFGVSVSPKMTKVEMDEKMMKRQERFGLGTATSTCVVSTSTTKSSEASDIQSKTDYAEKARLRLERFKNSAA